MYSKAGVLFLGAIALNESVARWVIIEYSVSRISQHLAHCTLMPLCCVSLCYLRTIKCKQPATFVAMAQIWDQSPNWLPIYVRSCPGVGPTSKLWVRRREAGGRLAGSTKSLSCYRNASCQSNPCDTRSKVMLGLMSKLHLQIVFSSSHGPRNFLARNHLPPWMTLSIMDIILFFSSMQPSSYDR